jgi:hypothetical protein
VHILDVILLLVFFFSFQPDLFLFWYVCLVNCLTHVLEALAQSVEYGIGAMI